MARKNKFLDSNPIAEQLTHAASTNDSLVDSVIDEMKQSEGQVNVTPQTKKEPAKSAQTVANPEEHKVVLPRRDARPMGRPIQMITKCNKISLSITDLANEAVEATRRATGRSKNDIINGWIEDKAREMGIVIEYEDQ